MRAFIFIMAIVLPFDPTPFITDEIPEPHGQIVYEGRALILIDERINDETENT